MVKAQEWLDANYPKDGISKDNRYIDNQGYREDGYSAYNLGKRRKEVDQALDLRNRDLEGELKLGGFTNLQALWCKGNKLTKLDLSDCKNLKEIWCAENQLTDLDFSNNSEITTLDLRDNPLTSLKPLQSLTKLRTLSLVNTNIKDGLEYLPSSLEEFYLRNSPIEDKIENYSTNVIGSLSYELYDYQAWRKNNQELIEKVKNNNKFIEFQLSLKEIPSKYWNKVEVGNDWDREYKVDNKRELPMMINDPTSVPNKRFRHEELLNSFKKYTNDEKRFFVQKNHVPNVSPGIDWRMQGPQIKDLNINQLYYIAYPERLTQYYLRDANKLFVKDGYGKVTSQEAFEFLQSIIESREIKATVKLTQSEYEKLLGEGTEKLTIADQKEKGCSEETKQSMEATKTFSEVMAVPTIQPHFLSVNKLEENDTIGEINYEEINHLNNYPISRNKKSSPQLPLRLFNVKEYGDENGEGEKDSIRNIEELKKYVEEVKERADIKNYATLSYVWGKVEDENELTSLGRKSLTKAIEACNSHLNIDYLWIDQLCINQKDREEKSEEVRKMRKCYGDSTVTLVSINTNLAEKKNDLVEILKVILSSEWFSRSWTFQEGWLSKQTIFMFDDCLVDGRAIATTWVLHQPQYAEVKFDRSEEGTKKIATPMGWVYYQGGYNFEDTISLNLSQALREISNRGRGIPVDGVYSILGLLPYGNRVIPKYKEKTQEGDHPIYFKEDVENALLEIMKEAIKAGYGEPLAWFGPSYNLSKKCWLPSIIFDEHTKEREKKQINGSTEVEGGINVLYKGRGNKSIDGIFTKDDNIKVNCSEYIIDGPVSGDVSKWDEGFTIKTGASYGHVVVKTENEGKYDLSIIKVLGTKDSLKKLNKKHLLLVPDKAEWESNRPFAILAERKKGRNRHRIGLVEIVEGGEKLKNDEQREVILGGYTIDNNQLEEAIFQHAEIEIPLK
ncbi:MAG: HET domain protein [Mycoplasmataceae bacterium RV_VA103A]|nr:MAG: HET domain protein [Mycoplasmataceae bacterium RV_VA103A]